MTIVHVSRLSVCAAALLAASGGPASAQDIGTQASNPCLATAADRGIVYDANQGLCWLQNANLAGDPDIRALMGVAGINPNGTMDWPTALEWVDALNGFDSGRGYLGHNNWQLPVTPVIDYTCSSNNNGTFGATCTGSAFGSLYVEIGRTFPDSIVPQFVDSVGSLRNLVPGLYWTSGSDGGGEKTFSFATGIRGSNTTKYNYMHVLPMIAGAVDTPPAGDGVLPYTSGSAAGKAVYDSKTGFSWALDANLASTHAFGVAGSTTIQSNFNQSVLTLPLIDSSGTMLLATASGTGGWLDAMNAANYAGANTWALPSVEDMRTLFDDLGLAPGSVLLESRLPVGGFRNFQPFFYWACQRVAGGDRRSPCDPVNNPPLNDQQVPMRWSFDFDNGFQGTDEITKQFYVEVYFPAPR